MIAAVKNQLLTCAYSPCPNDTFIFCGLSKDARYDVHLHDVETLNRAAFDETYDITKLSFHAWLLLQDVYECLEVGAALGRGCGPLVICRQGEQDTLDLKQARVAVPGEYTTAHLLLRLWNPEIENRIFMPFDQIMPAVESGQADVGVIIHEGRFVFGERGLHCIEDLGAWWEEYTGQPIPLGCIAARKALGRDVIQSVSEALKHSIEAAFSDPSSTYEYVKEHAQELEEDVIQQHIHTYVNDFTRDLGEEGRASISVLQAMAKEAGVIA